MRFSAHAVANAFAWMALCGLIGLAAVMVAALGFPGLLLLGGATWLICVLAELHDDLPTWGVKVFRAQADRSHSPEHRAALAEQKRAFISPLRFYRRCGVVLFLAGVAGTVWQIWAA